MLTRLILILASLLTYASVARAIDCNQIYAKASAKKGKPSCVFVDHTVGVTSVSTVTIYECGKTKYTLTSYADNTCKVSTK